MEGSPAHSPPPGARGASVPGSTLPVLAKALWHPGADLAPARTPPRPPWPWAAACGPGPGVGRSAEALHAASVSPAVSLGHVALGWLEGRILATSFSGGSAAVMINPRCVNRSVLQPFSSRFPALENAPLPPTSHARGPRGGSVAELGENPRGQGRQEQGSWAWGTAAGRIFSVPAQFWGDLPADGSEAVGRRRPTSLAGLTPQNLGAGASADGCCGGRVL